VPTRNFNASPETARMQPWQLDSLHWVMKGQDRSLHISTFLHFPRRPGPLKVWLLVLKEEGRPGRGGRAEAAFWEDRVTLTKPSLLLSLHFNGEAKISQLDCSTLAFTRQQQVLRLQKEQGEPCEAPILQSKGSPIWAAIVPLPGTRWRQCITSRRQRRRGLGS
jgi:hypothetical protein